MAEIVKETFSRHGWSTVLPAELPELYQVHRFSSQERYSVATGATRDIKFELGHHPSYNLELGGLPLGRKFNSGKCELQS